ncbi:MAG: DUF6291 domain-containing protein [Lachnospiraceae bacterium]|nr:DUF6291 domain-containing protein [Lachnospiraceae bacterium]
MESKKSFVMYDNWATLISNLPTEQAGQLIQAMCAFQLGQEPQIEDQAVKAMFIMIRGKMEEDSRNYAEKCAKAKASIQTRYQKKSEDLRTNTNVEDESTNVYERIRTKGDTETETDTENDTETDKVLPSTTDLPEDNDIPGDKTRECNYQGVVDAFNETCVSLPHVSTISDARKKAIRARVRQYGMDNILKAFQKAEASTFMKGGNKRNWTAKFDWIMNGNNMAKILDGNYDDDPNAGQEARGQPQRASPGYQSYAEQHDEVTRYLYEKAGGNPELFGR